MKESALISDRWKQIQERKERKEQFCCVIFGVLFIALIFTLMALMVLKGVCGG